MLKVNFPRLEFREYFSSLVKSPPGKYSVLGSKWLNCDCLSISVVIFLTISQIVPSNNSSKVKGPFHPVL